MLDLKTEKTAYRPGEVVRMTLTWRNESSEGREVHFSNTQRFDVLAERDGQKVWRWSDGMLFAQVLTTIYIAPGDSRVFQVEWQLKDSAGRAVPPGRYQLTAWIIGTGEQAKAEIEVVQ